MSRARKIIEDMLPGQPSGEAPKPASGGTPTPGQMTVGDMLAVLPVSDQNTVVEILNQCYGDTFEASKRLKPIFQKHAQALLDIGVVADYAAYAIPFAVYGS